MYMYEIVKFVGFFVRQFCLPNPFEAMWPEQAFVLNWVFGLILLPVAYFITGLWYRRGEGAAIGSFLFNVVYIGLTLLLWGVLEVVKIITDNFLVTAIIVGSVMFLVTAVMLTIRYFKKQNETDSRSQDNT